MTQAKFEDMFATMLAGKYGDHPTDWAAEACRWTQENEIFNGDTEVEKNFNWQMPITREAMTVVLYQFAKSKGLA